MEEEYEGLTEEEIAALEDDDEQETDTESDDLPDDEGDPEDDDPEDDPEQESEDDSEDDPEPEKEQEQEPEKKPTPESKPDEQEPEKDEDFDEKVNALDKELDDGDIDFDEYKARLLKIERERTRAVVREEMEARALEERWAADQKTFFEANPYIRENKIVMGAFAGEVNRLLDDDSWNGKSGPEILAEAKKSIDAAFGTGKRAPKKQEDEGANAVRKAKKATGKQQTPKTLKDVPAADSSNEHGEFAHLDGLEGAEYEAALDKLSPEQLERYAAS